MPRVYTRAMKSGGCSCGAVRYELAGELTPVTFCHCSKCRRWHGHVAAYTAIDRAGFRMTEARGLKWYAASTTVRRGFCAECGSSLLWDEDGDAKMGVAVGTIDAPTGLRPKAHVYVGSKGDYYDLPEDGLLRLVEFK
jgi:hypothetical protein